MKQIISISLNNWWWHNYIFGRSTVSTSYPYTIQVTRGLPGF